MLALTLTDLCASILVLPVVHRYCQILSVVV